MFRVTKALAPIAVLASLACGAELQVDVAGVSATQAILRYRSPNNRPCSVEISESSTFQPLVHDADPALFEAAVDSRSGRLNRGPARVFVAGQRKAQKARNGYWYSRALQADTVHYFRVNCGTATGTGSFRTATIALGNSYNEMQPPDPDVSQYTPAGAYAWPEFVSWTDRSETVIDPQTGLLLKRVSMPEDFVIDWLGDEAVGTAIDFDGKWNNPDAVKADDSAAAVFAGGGTNWLLLRADGMDLSDHGTATLGYLGRTINSIQVALKAWCSGPCTEEDRKIELCLTGNGVSCAGAIREQTLGMTAMEGGSAPLLVGTTTPVMDYWTAPGGRPVNRWELVVRTGTAAVNGRTVTWLGGNYFNMAWTAGSRIALNGQEYEIASVEGLKSLTLKSEAGTAKSVSYRAANGGVLLRKKTASADRISVQYARLKVGVSHLPEGWPSSGSPEVCQTAVTKDSAGNEGYRCVLQDAVPVVYWINRSSGEGKALGGFTTDSRGGTDGWGGTYCNGWFSSTEPDAFYCLVQDNSAAQNQVILRCRLTGANERGGWKPGCVNLTPASQGSGLAAQLAAFTGGKFDPAKFSCGVPGIQNERIQVVCTRAGQDSFGWLAVLDPAKAQPVCDARANNCVIAAQNTWSVAPARWCTMHTPFFMGAADWYWVAGRFLDDQGGAGQGPYVSQITSGSLRAGELDSCPANAVDKTVEGARFCSTVTVDGEPRDPSPHGGETGAPGELQNAEPGDVLQVDNELTQLLAKNGNTWVLRRGYGRNAAQEHAANRTLSEQCLAQPFERGTPSYSWSWDYLHDPTGANPQGTTVRKEFDFDHPAGRAGVVVGGASYLDCATGGCYQARTSGIWGAKPDVIVNGNAGFAGVPGGANGNAAENHASYAQVAAPDSDKRWMLDGRPFQPGPDTSGPFTPVEGQLYKLRTTTKDGDELSGPARLSRLKMPTFAFCGTQVLRDASSAATGDVLGTASADSYKYCVSRRKDECRQGAQPGDIWVNCPVVTSTSCANWSEQGNVTAGICVTVPHMYLSSVGQIGFEANDPKASLGRKLTMGLGRNMLVDPYWNQRALPDASWMLFRSVWLGGVRTEALLAKMVPYPKPDGIDRSDFVPMTVTATGQAVAGTDNVTVQFGYAENGGTEEYFCTSRREACVKGSASGYGMAGDTIAGVPCSGPCSITVPAISGRAMYYRVIYRDAENRVLAASAPAVSLVP